MIKYLQELSIYNNKNLIIVLDELKKIESRIPDKKESSKIYRDFNIQIFETMLEAFQLNLTKSYFLELSEQEAKNLENYLCASLLILDCKNAAGDRVSQKTWNEIEDRMLRPTGSK